MLWHVRESSGCWETGLPLLCFATKMLDLKVTISNVSTLMLESISIYCFPKVSIRINLSFWSGCNRNPVCGSFKETPDVLNRSIYCSCKHQGVRRTVTDVNCDTVPNLWSSSTSYNPSPRLILPWDSVSFKSSIVLHLLPLVSPLSLLLLNFTAAAVEIKP